MTREDDSDKACSLVDLVHPATRGEPSKKTPENLEALCELLAQGYTMAVACRMLPEPISPRSMQYWQRADAEVKAVVDDAVAAGCDVLAARMRQTARRDRSHTDDPIANPYGGESTGNVDYDKLIISTDYKLMGNWSKRYSPKVQHGGADDLPPISHNIKVEYVGAPARDD